MWPGWAEFKAANNTEVKMACIVLLEFAFAGQTEIFACLPSLQILPGDSRFLRQSPGHLQVGNYLQVFHSTAKYLQVAGP